MARSLAQAVDLHKSAAPGEESGDSELSAAGGPEVPPPGPHHDLTTDSPMCYVYNSGTGREASSADIDRPRRVFALDFESKPSTTGLIALGSQLFLTDV